MYKKSSENGIMKPTHTGDATVMPDRFSPQTDIRVLHRQDAVRRYMSPDVQQIQPHFHYQNEFLFTVGGTADFHISGKTYHVQSGSFLFVNNLENHYIISHSEGYDRYTVRFSNEALNTLIHDPLLLSIFKQRPSGFCHQYVCTPQEMKHYVLMLDIMTREYAEQAPYWDYLIASKLRDILIYMYRHQPNAFPGERGQSGQELIFNVQNYIESICSWRKSPIASSSANIISATFSPASPAIRSSSTSSWCGSPKPRICSCILIRKYSRSLGMWGLAARRTSSAFSNRTRDCRRCSTATASKGRRPYRTAAFLYVEEVLTKCV